MIVVLYKSHFQATRSIKDAVIHYARMAGITKKNERPPGKYDASERLAFVPLTLLALFMGVTGMIDLHKYEVHVDNIVGEENILWLSVVSSDDRKFTELIKYISERHFDEIDLTQSCILCIFCFILFRIIIIIKTTKRKCSDRYDQKYMFHY